MAVTARYNFRSITRKNRRCTERHAKRVGKRAAKRAAARAKRARPTPVGRTTRASAAKLATAVPSPTPTSGAKAKTGKSKHVPVKPVKLDLATAEKLIATQTPLVELPRFTKVYEYVEERARSLNALVTAEEAEDYNYFDCYAWSEHVCEMFDRDEASMHCMVDYLIPILHQPDRVGELHGESDAEINIPGVNMHLDWHDVWGVPYESDESSLQL
jgi:hypothetical protein